MATWQDGPEYAPTARPDEFAEPQVAPLEEPPAVAVLIGAPAERPRFSEPAAPVAPLADLIPVPADQRDPSRAFDVVSSTLTAGGPWGGIHGSLPGADSAGQFPPAQPPPAQPQPAQLQPAQAQTDWPPPSWPPAQSSSPFPTVPGAQPPPGFPQPGTPQWFGPSPYGEQPTRGRADARALWAAATPGLLIVLAIAVLIKVLAPVLLVVCFFLARRVLVARVAVQRSFVVALTTIGTFALIGLFTGPLDFGDWWSFVGTWSRLVSLGVLVSTLLLVRRALLAGEVPTPPQQEPPAYRGPWG